MRSENIVSSRRRLTGRENRFEGLKRYPNGRQEPGQGPGNADQQDDPYHHVDQILLLLYRRVGTAELVHVLFLFDRRRRVAVSGSRGG